MTGPRRSAVYRFEGFALDVGEHLLTRDGAEVALRPKPFETLFYLVERHGHLVTKDELLDAVWPGSFVSEGALTRCIKEIRQALGDDAREPRFIQTRPRLGYIFVASVESAEGTTSTPLPDPSVPVVAQRSRVRVALAAALALAALGSYALWERLDTQAGAEAGPQSTGATERTMIAVLPFENLGHEDDQYFSVGMSDEIMTRLAAVRELRVISHTTAFQYDRSGKTLPEIGRDLGVEYVLEGSVLWDSTSPTDAQVRITPQLVRVSDDSHVWAHSYERVLDDLFDVQSEIASEVVRHLGLTLTESEHRSVDLRPTENLEAYRAFLLGRYYAGQPHFTVETWRRVLDYYQQAVELDPRFAVAWAELAKAHSRFYFLKADTSTQRQASAEAAVDQALALAPDAATSRTALGYYHLWVEGNAKQALRELGLAERSRPNDAEVLSAIATLLRAEGRWRDARLHFERAVELSPRDPWLALELAYIFWPTREYERAVSACDRSRDLLPDPSWRAWPNLTKAFTYWSWNADLESARAALAAVPPEHAWAGWAWYWQRVFEGRYDQAARPFTAGSTAWVRTKIVARPHALLAAMARSFAGKDAEDLYAEAVRLLSAEMRDSPDDPRLRSSLGIALAAVSDREAAVREGKRAVELFPMSKDAFYGVPQVLDLAYIYTLVGETDAALDQLDYLLSVPSWLSPAWLRVDPRWDALRDHPRFQRLAKTVEETRRGDPVGAEK